jgi:hypothetical protein
LIGAIAFVCASYAPSLGAEPALVPIVAGAHGVHNALWSSEVRLTNRADAPRQLTVVDWIGDGDWHAATYVVPAHSTRSIGGFDFAGFPMNPVVGIAVCDADPGLLVQTAILTGIYSVSLKEPCPSFDGGGSPCLGPVGAGPLVEDLAFTAPGVVTFVPWLHSHDSRRTNLVIVNPDSVTGHVTLRVASQDGGETATAQFDVGARSLLQLNDLFAREPWSTVRRANGYDRGGATATLSSDTRLLAIAYVIGNYDNSVTVSTPR